MSVLNQKTIKKNIIFNGVGLHSGLNANLTIKPAEPNTGIVFKRTDIKYNNIIIPNIFNVSSAVFCTTISNEQGVNVSTIEHLMGALYGMGIDNVLIEIDNEIIYKRIIASAMTYGTWGVHFGIQHAIISDDWNYQFGQNVYANDNTHPLAALVKPLCVGVQEIMNLASLVLVNNFLSIWNAKLRQLSKENGNLCADLVSNKAIQRGVVFILKNSKI